MKLIKRLIIVIILVELVAGVAIVVIFGVPGYNMYKKALEETPVSEKVASIQKKKNYSKYEELPEMYVNAVIATEDRRFYDHSGIDYIAVMRAIYNDLKAQKFVEGGSTITQQLAKNIYFTQEKSGKRKIAEIFMAAELEKNCEKNIKNRLTKK